MEIAEQTHGAVLLLKPQGALAGTDEAASFARTLIDASTRALGRVVVDVSGVPFVDSAGLEAIADLAERFSDGGRALKLLSPTPTVREVLLLTGWLDSVEVYDDINVAVRSYL
jgi:anti-anti-sigma factor